MHSIQPVRPLPARPLRGTTKANPVRGRTVAVNGIHKPRPEPITIGIINYNGRETLAETVEAVLALDYPEFEVMVVDNHSGDGSQEIVLAHPAVQCVRLNANLGLPGARNVVLHMARTRYVLIIDNDIVLEPGALTHLMDVLRKNPGTAVCHPEIVDVHDTRLSFHYNGGHIHYLGVHVPRETPGPVRAEHEVFDVVSGGALLIDRSVAGRIGGFDADYFFNWEDGDFTARASLAGYRCLNVPGAIAHHRHKSRGTTKAFFQVRNRWYFILKFYAWRTLLLAAPMLLLFEVLQAAFLLSKGAFGDYLRGSLAALGDLPRILEKRRRYQKLKVVRDRDWLRSGPIFVPSQLMNGRLVEWAYAGCRRLFDAYWQMIRPFC